MRNFEFSMSTIKASKPLKTSKSFCGLRRNYKLCPPSYSGNAIGIRLNSVDAKPPPNHNDTIDSPIQHDGYAQMAAESYFVQCQDSSVDLLMHGKLSWPASKRFECPRASTPTKLRRWRTSRRNFVRTLDHLNHRGHRDHKGGFSVISVSSVVKTTYEQYMRIQ